MGLENKAPVIRIDHVSHRYRGANTAALSDVSLDIPEGCCLGLIGPNGAGKSTLLSLLTSLLPLKTGHIEIMGLTPRRARAMSAVVPQDLAIYPALTGAENLAFFASAYRLKRRIWRDRYERCVDACKLDSVLDRRSETYSGGLKRRLNLAIALLSEPRILYLDEPTVGIDALSRQCIIEVIRGMSRAGATIIYTSHYMEEVEALCDEIAVINRGRIVASGRKADLLSARGEGSLDITFNAQLPEACRSLPKTVFAEDRRIKFAVSGPDAIHGILTQLSECGADIASVNYNTQRLEQLYLDLLGNDDEAAA